MTGPSDDDLRARLARLDPAGAGTTPDEVTARRVRDLVEETMRTETMPADAGHPLPAPPQEDRSGRRTWAPAAAAAAVAAVAVPVGLWLFPPGGDDAPPGAAPTTAGLSLPDPLVAGSCLAFDVEVLAQMPTALAGTVTAVDGREVVLDVDRWYRGGDADRVVLEQHPQQTSAALDGVEFAEGERYLLTASEEGTVNGCGFSGPASADLERAFEEAFAG